VDAHHALLGLVLIHLNTWQELNDPIPNIYNTEVELIRIATHHGFFIALFLHSVLLAFVPKGKKKNVVDLNDPVLSEARPRVKKV
jgi:hypothetical protein